MSIPSSTEPTATPPAYPTPSRPFSAPVPARAPDDRRDVRSDDRLRPLANPSQVHPNPADPSATYPAPSRPDLAARAPGAAGPANTLDDRKGLRSDERLSPLPVPAPVYTPPSTVGELQAQNAALVAQLARARAESAATVQRIAELQTDLNANPSVPESVHRHVSHVREQAQSAANVITEVVQRPRFTERSAESQRQEDRDAENPSQRTREANIAADRLRQQTDPERMRHPAMQENVRPGTQPNT